MMNFFRMLGRGFGYVKAIFVSALRAIGIGSASTASAVVAIEAPAAVAVEGAMLRKSVV